MPSFLRAEAWALEALLVPGGLGEGGQSCRPGMAPFPDTWTSLKGSRLATLSQQQMGKLLLSLAAQCAPVPTGHVEESE